MKLEDEIKQKEFKNEYHKLTVNILFTSGWLNSIQKNYFDPFGITNAQYNILRILRGQHPNPTSVNLLKDRMLDKMSDASRLIERLRVKGFVERKICKNDRRKSEVKITKEGLSLLKKLDVIEKVLENQLSNISPKEAKSINDLLDKMRN